MNNHEDKTDDGKKTDGPMFDKTQDYTDISKPSLSDYQTDTRAIKAGDISLQVMAAIELRIPDSGIDWLDKMIAKAERRDIAVKAMQALIANADSGCCSFDRMAADSYDQADAMNAERAKGECNHD